WSPLPRPTNSAPRLGSIGSVRSSASTAEANTAVQLFSGSSCIVTSHKRHGVASRVGDLAGERVEAAKLQWAGGHIDANAAWLKTAQRHYALGRGATEVLHMRAGAFVVATQQHGDVVAEQAPL